MWFTEFDSTEDENEDCSFKPPREYNSDTDDFSDRDENYGGGSVTK